METTKALQMRQSVRSYKSEQITDSELSSVLDAAYLAPVAMGQYEDTQLLVIQDAATLNTLNDLFGKQIGDTSMKPTYGAPTVIFVLGKSDAEEILIGANASVIVENMTIAASDIGLGSCYLFGVSQATQGNADVRSLLKLQDGWRTVAGIALGYPADTLTERTVDTAKMVTNYIK